MKTKKQDVSVRSIAGLVLAFALTAPEGVRAQAVSPSAVYQPTSHPVTVFVDGPGWNLYDKYWNGSTWVWENQGAPPGTLATSVLSAVYQPTVRPLVVFAVGANGELFDKYYDAGWTWQSQGNPGVAIYGSSAVYDPASGQVIDFVGGKNLHLYSLSGNGTKGTWADHGTPTATGLEYCCATVYQTASNTTTVFVSGTNGHLYDNYSDGSKWVWEDQGTPPGTTPDSAPTAVYDATTHDVYAFVTGANGHLLTDYWNGTKWQWKDIGTPPGATVCAPSAAYQAEAYPIAVFVGGSNGHLYDAYLDGSTWVWEDQGIPPGDIGVFCPSGLSALDEPATHTLMVFLNGTKSGDLYQKYWDTSASKWVWENLGQP